ncbi:hypothetical protein NDU88_002118 [Pleurodeles waltl]|uniref:Uncharacterized protein n=1 Tax=Pleurodeles waltl TaxID=8319 RepID=A0AAV7KRA0_PLEWA|nr:hypothetical protein NDU88_002118 [Pleurodeles waltl]
MADANVATTKCEGGRGPRTSHSALFPENEGSVQSPVVLWEAYKATVRGEIIAGEVRERQQREKRMVTLETELITLERRYATQPTQDIKKQMKQKREEYNIVTRHKVRQQYLLQSKWLYEAGNKAGKLLAWLGKNEQSDSLIGEIWTAKGEPTRDPKEIMEEMAAQMEDFYKSRITIPEAEIDSFITDCPMTHLSLQQTADLEEEITEVGSTRSATEREITSAQWFPSQVFSEARKEADTTPACGII